MSNLFPRGCYVMLHIGSGPAHPDEEKGSPRLVVTSGDRFALNDDFWIERLDEELAKHVQAACDSPHYNIERTDHDRHLYAFLRRVPSAEASRYEGMNELQAVAALSRLIHPTSVGQRYCAHIIHYGREDSAIIAIRYGGVSPDVLLKRGQRDWLSVEDAENLRKLMLWVPKTKSMHKRVHLAYWNHEYAMHSYYLDMRWTLVVSGLEALINVGKDDIGEQFRCRARLLAKEFSISLSDDDLAKAWKLRSKLTHAKGFLHDLDTTLPQSQHSSLYERLEELLRVTIKRCLLDEKFGNYFKDDASVKSRWAYTPKPKPSARRSRSKP